MATPEHKTATHSNSMVVAVMFAAVIGTAAVLYATLEKEPPRQLGHKAVEPPVLAQPERASPPAAPAAAPVAQAPRTKTASKKATPKQVAKPPRPVAPPPPQPQLSRDDRIEADVRNAIYRTPNLHGKIAVEANDGIVTLDGWTLTPGEAHRAAAAARRVKDVKQVQNNIRPRMAGGLS